MNRRIAMALALSLSATVLAALAPSSMAADSQSEPKAWADRCSAERLGAEPDTISLAPALSQNADSYPDGDPVRIEPDSRGRFVPVIMVHGWVGKSTHTDQRDGAFSSFIDLTANRIADARVTRSLIGQIQSVPGAAVFTFDYRDLSTRWVDDPKLGPALGDLIDCLYEQSGERVIIVGHSMGGLLTQYAATHPGVTGDDRGDEISTVVTFGTPYTGSVAAGLTNTAVSGAGASAPSLGILRMILSACGSLSSSELTTGSLCDELPEPIRAFDSNAGRALRAGSAELAALKPFPDEISVDALAGDANFEVPATGWFALPWQTESVPVGDLIVTAGSATSRADLTKKVRCSYQLNPVRGATDSLGLTFQQVARNDVAASPLGAMTGPCFHTQLMRGIELTNEAVGIIADDIESRLGFALRDLLSARVPSACEHPPGRLVDGSLPGIPELKGSVTLGWQPGVRGRARTVAIGDFTGDGATDAVALLYCNAGGVGWPNVLALYSAGPQLIGGIALSDLDVPDARMSNTYVYRMWVEDGGFVVRFATQQSGDVLASASIDIEATFRWQGDSAELVDVRTVNEEPSAARFLEEIRAGGETVSAEFATGRTVARAVELERLFPEVFKATPKCFGEIDLDLPRDVQVLVNEAPFVTTRVCSLQADKYGSRLAIGLEHRGFETWTVEWIEVA